MRKQMKPLAQLHFDIQPRHDPFYHRPKTSGTVNFKRAHQAASSTVKFGLDLSDRLLATGDFDGAKGLVELLLPLRGNMLREKD
jgi:hypothetical protein